MFCLSYTILYYIAPLVKWHSFYTRCIVLECVLINIEKKHLYTNQSNMWSLYLSCCLAACDWSKQRMVKPRQKVDPMKQCQTLNHPKRPQKHILMRRQVLIGCRLINGGLLHVTSLCYNLWHVEHQSSLFDCKSLVPWPYRCQGYGLNVPSKTRMLHLS